jgi:hypothetical protein
MKRMITACLCLLGLLLGSLLAQAQDAGLRGGLSAAFGPRFQPDAHSGAAADRHRQPAAGETTRRVLYWNEAALKAIGLDHVPVRPGEIRVYGEQFGPTHSSRALAIVQLAVFDAINAIGHRYPSYAGLPPAPSDTSPDAAIARAAHDTLAALYPSQRQRFDEWLAADLARLPDGRAKDNGVALGRRAAAAILALRANDHADDSDRTVGVDYFPSNLPGQWRPDPVSMNPLALGATWYKVPPFALPSLVGFHVPVPPALTSSAYASAFYEVKRVGGDGVTTPTVRTHEETVAGICWGYDGVPWVGTPPRLFNQIAVQIAQGRTTDPVEMARLLALVNVALVDASIAIWTDKYRYDFWRPVTAIREADEGSGPTGRGDGNPDTHGKPSWTPLGAQASNLKGPDFTPPFPSYPSGHAGFGGALFQVLRRFYGTDRISFSFVFDEYNGITRDNSGYVRPRIVRSYASLSQAEEENGQSRIYIGVHWHFDKTAGVAQGRRVANYVFEHGLVQP